MASSSAPDPACAAAPLPGPHAAPDSPHSKNFGIPKCEFIADPAARLEGAVVPQVLDGLQQVREKYNLMFEHMKANLLRLEKQRPDLDDMLNALAVLVRRPGARARRALC